MKTTGTKPWNPHGNIDNAANVSVLATAVFVVLIGAATVDTEPVSQATQIARQDGDGRVVVTASRSGREETADSAPTRVATGSIAERAAKREDAVLVAAFAPEGSFPFNSRSPKGDDHAK
jgi:hypothetical protein